jgi:biopolymer transport protein ExbB
MMTWIDNWLPWLGDLLALGGPILGLILVIAFAMWTLLFERVNYLLRDFPRDLRMAEAAWRSRRDKTSWYAQQFRDDLQTSIAHGLQRNFSLISTMIKLCPLLGLLGTVMGMLEVFDALAATGSNNPRSMAAGVSKATVSTLAGMVVAIVGLLAHTVAERKANATLERLPAYFKQTQET